MRQNGEGRTSWMSRPPSSNSRFHPERSEGSMHLNPRLCGEYDKPPLSKRVLYNQISEMTPMLKMYTLGHKTDMNPIKGDGLRYHGCSPIISLLRNKGYIDTIAYPGDEKHVFNNTKLFIQSEGWLPAPESAYSVCCAIDEAIKCRESGEKKVIAFNISGHGFLDIPGYNAVLGLEWTPFFQYLETIQNIT